MFAGAGETGKRSTDKAGIPEPCFTPNALRGMYHLSQGRSQWLPDSTWLRRRRNTPGRKGVPEEGSPAARRVKACLFGGGLLYKGLEKGSRAQPERRSYSNTMVKSHKGRSTKENRRGWMTEAQNLV